MYRSIDCYGPDPDGQATFYGRHKVTVFIWPDCLSKGLSELDVQKSLEKNFKRTICDLKIYYKLLQFCGFTDKFFIIKLLRWDGCFTETLVR